jgi:hypothetical protein
LPAGFFAALPASAGPASGADIAVLLGIAEAVVAGAEAVDEGIAEAELAGMSDDGMPASGVSTVGITGGVGFSPPHAATTANGARTRRSLRVRMGFVGLRGAV